MYTIKKSQDYLKKEKDYSLKNEKILEKVVEVENLLLSIMNEANTEKLKTKDKDTREILFRGRKTKFTRCYSNILQFPFEVLITTGLFDDYLILYNLEISHPGSCGDDKRKRNKK